MLLATISTVNHKCLYLFLLSHLSCAEEVRVSNAIVVDAELVHSVHVGNAELGHILGARAFQGGAYEWVDADELQLNIILVEGLPLSIAQLFDFNGELLQ